MKGFRHLNRNWYAAVALIACLAIYLCFESLSDSIRHVLLTLAAVVAVHLIDRLFLFRDTHDALEEIQKDLRKEIRDLVRSSESLEAMVQSGIVRLYSSRSEASEDIKDDLIKPNNKEIRLMGISLNDFVQATQPTLRNAWETIEAYINGEKRIHDQKTGLQIKILIIDPDCFGAKLRSEGEARGQHAMVTRLPDEVRASARAFSRLEDIAKSKQHLTGVTLDCKLYRIAPTVFMCHVDSICYAQQYHFWRQRDVNTSIPAIKYRETSGTAEACNMHQDLASHFDWIWEHASVRVDDFLSKSMLGFDKGIMETGLINVFTAAEKAERRMLYLLANAEQTVWIQGISLHSYFSYGALFAAISKIVLDTKVCIKVLLIDPESEQARYRSYRERSLNNSLPQMSFEEYKAKPQQHTGSDLYRDTTRTIENLKNIACAIRQQGVSNDELDARIQVRLYGSAPACFLLRVDGAILAEQYLYGKILHGKDQGKTQTILGKDMPLVEYAEQVVPLYEKDANPYRIPFGLLEDHFKFAFQQGKKVSLAPLEIL